MESPPGRDAAPDPVRFKTSKKRKAYRQRQRDDDDDQGDNDGSRARRASPGTEAVPESSGAHQDDGEESALAATLRLRNAGRGRRLGGLVAGFTSSAARADDDAGALVRRGQEEDSAPVIKGIADRFTHQTGLIADLNEKHMYAPSPAATDRTTPLPRPGANQSRNEYIESRLSSRNAPPGTLKQPAAPLPSQSAEQAASGPSVKGAEQPAKHGKLLEVDVPHGNAWDRAGDAKRQRVEKPPKPRRGRNRRGSDDIKRDQLVEQFLRENKCSSPPSTPSVLSSTFRLTRNVLQWMYTTSLRRPAYRPPPPLATTSMPTIAWPSSSASSTSTRWPSDASASAPPYPRASSSRRPTSSRGPSSAAAGTRGPPSGTCCSSRKRRSRARGSRCARRTTKGFLLSSSWWSLGCEMLTTALAFSLLLFPHPRARVCRMHVTVAI